MGNRRAASRRSCWPTPAASTPRSSSPGSRSTTAEPRSSPSAATWARATTTRRSRRRPSQTGASKCIVKDLREEFVRDYCYKALSAGAVYEDRYLLGTALARPLLAYHQVQVAIKEKADALAHGATGKGNDQVRFEVTYGAFAPNMKVIAPWREWTIRSREDALDYARKHGVPVDQTKKDLFSRDGNLWHLSHEGGNLEDVWDAPQKGMFKLTVDPLDAPAKPQLITLGFERGVPVTLDGKRLKPVQMIETLNRVAGAHGVGRLDLVENRLVGIKSRGVYETPAGTVLHIAHRELERLVLDRDTLHFKQAVSVRYAQLVYDGLWFSTLREALAGFVDETEKEVTGEVRIRLYKGSAEAVGRRSRAQPLPAGPRHLRRGHGLRPQGRGGLHPPLRPPGAGPGAHPRPRDRGREGGRGDAAGAARPEAAEVGAASVSTGVTAPLGFRAAAVASGIKPDRLDLALLVADAPCTAAGVFTANLAQAAPVLVSREHLALGPGARDRRQRRLRERGHRRGRPRRRPRDGGDRGPHDRLHGRGGARGLDRRHRRAPADGEGPRRHRGGGPAHLATRGGRRGAGHHDHRHEAQGGRGRVPGRETRRASSAGWRRAPG